MEVQKPCPAADIEIRRKREAWERKPSLRKIYRQFHAGISGKLRTASQGLTVELGSGTGDLRETIPACLMTDTFSASWLDRRENAYALSFADNSVENLILFDVWHHLEFPGTALDEFERVLGPAGRLILFEPAMSLVGKIVYGLFHPEPIALDGPIVWHAPAGFDPDAAPYFAAQSRAERIFHRRECPQWTARWNLVSLESITSFAYLLSGGFSGRQLYPDRLLPALQRADRLLGDLPGIFAARLLIVLEKKGRT